MPIQKNILIATSPSAKNIYKILFTNTMKFVYFWFFNRFDICAWSKGKTLLTSLNEQEGRLQFYLKCLQRLNKHFCAYTFLLYQTFVCRYVVLYTTANIIFLFTSPTFAIFPFHLAVDYLPLQVNLIGVLWFVRNHYYIGRNAGVLVNKK